MKKLKLISVFLLMTLILVPSYFSPEVSIRRSIMKVKIEQAEHLEDRNYGRLYIVGGNYDGWESKVKKLRVDKEFDPVNNR